MSPTTPHEPPPLPWGALARWQREMGTTPPARWDYTDPLYRLACVEANARDAYRAGLPSHVRLDREKYERIVAESVAQSEAA